MTKFFKEINPIRIEYDTSNYRRLVFQAAENGDINLLYSILEDFPELIRAVGCLNETLLHLVSKYGYIDCIKLLIDRGADINCNTSRYKNIMEGTPLNQAVYENQLLAAQFLLNAGARVDLKANGATLLHHVSSIEMAELLLRYGADINTVWGEHTRDHICIGNSVLHSIIWWNSKVRPELLLFLIKNGANARAINETSDTTLHLLIYSQVHFRENLNILLNAGANLLAENNQRRTPLDLANRIDSKSKTLIAKATKDYSNIRNAALVFTQALKTSHAFFSFLPNQLLEKISVSTVESDILEKKTKKCIFRNHLKDINQVISKFSKSK